MAEKVIIDDGKLIGCIMDIGLTNGLTKPATIIASGSAKRIHEESMETKINRKINKILR